MMENESKLERMRRITREATKRYYDRKRGADIPLRKSAGARLFGPDNPAWKGDSAGIKAGWARAKRRFAAEVCLDCGGAARDRHHIDRNPLNNATENVVSLCRSCHRKRHIKEGW